jgi:signal transduction histidine kinase
VIRVSTGPLVPTVTRVTLVLPPAYTVTVAERPEPCTAEVGTLTPLPRAVVMVTVAYRIVQESLSNAGRHAPGATVTVSVGHDASAVLLRVVNGPGGAAGPLVNGLGPGQGLSGMRERVALLGGSFSAGPAPDGGFVVSAVLPLSEAA